MAIGRAGHTATLLPNGKVLVVGGGPPELLDPVTGQWGPSSTTTSMAVATRPGHTATLLPNGLVLVVGGDRPQTTVELYDPVNMRWIRSPNSHSVPRDSHTATLMPSGKVIVMGGIGQEAPGSSVLVTLSSVEVYDFRTDSWSSPGPGFELQAGRANHTATLLPNGFIVIAGGQRREFTKPPTFVPTDAVELFEPANGLFGTASRLQHNRQRHSAAWVPAGGPLGSVVVFGGEDTTPNPTFEVFTPNVQAGGPGPTTAGTWAAFTSPVNWRESTATLLQNGRVLVVSSAGAAVFDPQANSWGPLRQTAAIRGGHTATLLESGRVLLAGSSDGSTFTTAETYRTVLSGNAFRWTSAPAMSSARADQTATLLPDGKVLVAGGFAQTSLASAEFFDPSTSQWTVAASMVRGRWRHTATMLPNGKVLVAGGIAVNGATATAELFDVWTRTWTATGAMATARSNHTAMLLPNGQVLVAGGAGSNLSRIHATEVYDPTSGQWRPAGNMTFVHEGPEATLLPDGRVLIAGGSERGQNNAPSPALFAEVYDWTTGQNAATGNFGTWSLAGGPHTARYGHAATFSRSGGPAGRVLLSGGTTSAVPASSDIERFDATQSGAAQWLSIAQLGAARTSHADALLPTGRLLSSGGRNASGAMNGSEVFDPLSSTRAIVGNLATPRHSHVATRLYNGQILVTGGRDTGGTSLASAELYTDCPR